MKIKKVEEEIVEKVEEFCHHCKDFISTGHNFCGKCGKGLSKEKLQQTQKTITPEHPSHITQGNKEINLTGSVFLKIFGFIFFILFIFFLLTPTKAYTYEVDVPYEDTETYYEKEPYDVQEAYTVPVSYEVMEKYEDTVPIQVNVPYTTYEDKVYVAEPGSHYTNVPSGCRCTDYSFFLRNCIELTCNEAKQEYRTETQQKTITKERPVTKTKQETRYRTVTKYKDVRKTRTVTKVRSEEREYEVNWLFNFPVGWELRLFN